MSYLCNDRYWSIVGMVTSSASLSVTSGPAPLGVFVDLTGVTYTGTSTAFHDLRFVTNWGDPSSGNFSNGKQMSKNISYGAVGAHVYETASTYTVATRIFNGLAEVEVVYSNVVVTDPNTVFATTNTLVVSASTDFTGKPTGARELTETDWENIVTYARSGGPEAPYHRILLRRDDVFVANASAGHGIANFAGPAILGAWSTGVLPTVSSTVTAAGTANILTIAANKWRVMDINFTGPGGADAPDYQGISTDGVTNITELTILRCGAFGVNTGINTLSAGQTIIQDSTVSSLSGVTDDSGHGIRYGKTSAAGTLPSYHALLGNYIDLGDAADRGQVYAARGFSPRHGIVSNNTLDPGAFADFGALKIGSDRTYATDADLTIYNIASDNIEIGVAAAFGVMGTGVNAVNLDQRMQDFICEANLWQGMAGGATNDHPMANVPVPNCSVRNNLFIATKGTTKGGMCVWAQFVGLTGTTPQNQTLWCYNNSAFSSDSTESGELQFFRSEDTSTISYVKNNLAFFPNATSPLVIKTTAGTVNTATNTGDLGSVTTQPFTSSVPSTSTHFVPIGYARSTATLLPVWDDYNRRQRTYGNIAPIYDMGAIQVT